MSPQRTDTGDAIRFTLVSPNEGDSNGAIARAIDQLAAAMRGEAARPSTYR